MEKIRKSLMMKKLYHIHNEELDPYKDCENAINGTIIILPNKCILNVFFVVLTDILKYIIAHNVKVKDQNKNNLEFLINYFLIVYFSSFSFF